MLALVSTTALAFQEQQQGAPAPAAPAAKEEAAPAQQLNVPAPAAKPEGTVVTIPGLGQLGVLPKMDFGLELLYGANGKSKPEAEPNGQPQLPADDELTIRGSVKKTF